MPIEEPGNFSDNYKVRLVSVLNPSERVVFDVSPVVGENRSVDYTPLEPVHMPGGIYAYRKTSSREFTISAKFVSRSKEQASKNMKLLQLLRSWNMPYFGKSASAGTSEGAEVLSTLESSGGSMNMLGAPPDILYLYAYSSDEHSSRESMVNINKIPVVMNSLRITYPEDVDYIPSLEDNEPFPVKMDIEINLLEVHSPREYQNFDLSKFRQGKLVGF